THPDIHKERPSQHPALIVSRDDCQHLGGVEDVGSDYEDRQGEVKEPCPEADEEFIDGFHGHLLPNAALIAAMRVASQPPFDSGRAVGAGSGALGCAGAGTGSGALTGLSGCQLAHFPALSLSEAAFIFLA